MSTKPTLRADGLYYSAQRGRRLIPAGQALARARATGSPVEREAALIEAEHFARRTVTPSDAAMADMLGVAPSTVARWRAKGMMGVGLATSAHDKPLGRASKEV